MRVLVDTNVLVDLALVRQPWGEDATALALAVTAGQAHGLIAAHAVTTAYYLVARERGAAAARAAVGSFVSIFEVVPVDHDSFVEALALDVRDFEDAVQVTAAQRGRADVIVTRNGRDFVRSPIPARTPGELLAMLPPSAPATG